MSRSKITDWSKVDWSRKLADIAAEIGCHPDSAAKAKSRLGLTKPYSPHGRDPAKRRASLRQAKDKQYAKAKATGACLKCQAKPADEGSKTCAVCREKMKAYYHARKKNKKA